jgi:hypothetical protein
MGFPPRDADAPFEDLLALPQTPREPGRKRRNYRIQIEGLATERSSLRIIDTDVPVRIINISAAGAQVLIPVEVLSTVDGSANTLSDLTLQFVLQGETQVITLPGRVANARPDPDGMRLGITFNTQVSARQGLAAKLLALLNQRSALRVTPSPKSVLRVLVCDLNGAKVGEGTLYDLSVEGVGLLVEDADTAQLMDRPSVILHLPIRPGRDPVVALAAPRHTRASTSEDGGEAKTLCGFAFDYTSPESSDLRMRLGGYIVRRQLALARER